MQEPGVGAVEWVRVPCPLCDATDCDPVYRRVHETGAALGRLEKTDVMCRDCGFVYTSPRPSAADMGRYYAEASGASGSVFHSLEPGARLPALTRERVAFVTPRLRKHFGDAPGRLLDVGCSTGDLLAAFDLPGWQRAGLEPSRRAAAIARERGLDVRTGELESGGLASRGYEVVCCISALEHVWDLRGALGRLADALVPGGLAFLEVPDSTRPVAQVAEFYSFEHLSHFTRGTLCRALASVGLEPVDFDEAPSLPNLRICARRVEPGVALDAAGFEDDRETLLAAIGRYRAERDALEQALVGRLGERAAAWSRLGARVALYGAGMHSRFLLGLLDLREAIACVLDGDPSKQGGRFLDWPVHAPEALPELGLDAVLISTRAFEQEVYDALAPVARDHGIEVVRCYA